MPQIKVPRLPLLTYYEIRRSLSVRALLQVVTSLLVLVQFMKFAYAYVSDMVALSYRLFIADQRLRAIGFTVAPLLRQLLF